MKVEDFNYELPPELIAQVPVEPRDSSRLLMLGKHDGEIRHAQFRDLLNEVRAGDVWVFNNTRVIPARLYGHRPTGGKVEVLLLHPLGEDRWEVLVKPGKKALPGTEIIFAENLRAQVEEKTDFGGRILRFSSAGDFDAIVEKIGEMPLPPYIHARLEDKDRYQTVYSEEKGSAAAPTAGLHFTPELLREMQERGAEIHYVTLHVGLGTFRPVSVERIEEHVMHRESYYLSEETVQAIQRAKREARRVVAVGTTTVRTLESAAATGELVAGAGETELFIYPGYEFRIVDAMVTNFHLPQSTLLMMISAFAGQENVFHAYEEAVREKYRFFSFGDAMWIR